MANPFVKSYKYFMSWFGAKVDEKADPKIQIQQAIEEAQRQHQALCQQAAQVIGNQRQLEMKLSRQLSDVERLQSNARQALILADKKRSEGDEAEAQKMEQSAQAFANQLVTAEKSPLASTVIITSRAQPWGSSASAAKYFFIPL